MKYLFMSVAAMFLSANLSLAQLSFKKLNGKWESLSSEDLGNGAYGHRAFKFNDNQWELWFTMFLDKEMKSPVFTFRTTGTFEILSNSSVKDAQNAVFKFDKKYLTLKTSDASIAGNFGFTGCDLKPDLEKDISETGCSFLPSVANYAKEFDLLSISGNSLYLGARPADGNMGSEDKRPTSLGSPLKRKS